MLIATAGRHVKGVHIIDVAVADRTTLGEGGAQLRGFVSEQVFAGERNFLLNLAVVPSINRTGIGELGAAFTTVSLEGGKLKLLNLSKRVSDLFTLTKLIGIFEVFDDEASALRSFDLS